jgi:2-haloacid dehalogenase
LKKQVLVFDVYGTLFNVFSLSKVSEDLFMGKGEEISQLWRKKQLEYSFLRELMGTYVPFEEVTRDALRYTAEVLKCNLTEKNEKILMDEYKSLDLYPEVEKVLRNLSENYTLAIFSNGNRDMLIPLVEQAGISHFFDHIISADEGKNYKPSAAAYRLVTDKYQIEAQDVLFFSSNTWDISGAKTFGFNTAWVNRTGIVMDKLGVSPDITIKDLKEIIRHL